MPKFESSRLNGERCGCNRKDTHTHPHTYILPNLGNTLKKKFSLLLISIGAVGYVFVGMF